MMTRRFCPGCAREFSEDEVLPSRCEECGARISGPRKVAPRKRSKQKHRSNMNSYARRRKMQRLAQRDGRRCWLCGGHLSLGEQDGPKAVSIDHVIPLAEGGTNRDENCRLAHKLCNSSRPHLFPHTL